MDQLWATADHLLAIFELLEKLKGGERLMQNRESRAINKNKKILDWIWELYYKF